MASLQALPTDQAMNPLLDWNAHLFTVQRTQYIIMTNTASLYSMIMYGRGITSDKQFAREALSCMKEFMTIAGHKAITEKFIDPEDKSIFSKIIDRRVMGSMNDLVFQAKIHLSEGRKSLFDVSLLLNESPMSYLGYSRPKEEFSILYSIDSAPSGDRQGKDNVICIDDYRPPIIKF